MFEVKKEMCNECLYSNKKVVSSKRRSSLLKECKANDSYFICHKSSIEGGAACCKGFYDSTSTNLIRISQRLNMVKFVD